jgi:hypothetical protein
MLLGATLLLATIVALRHTFTLMVIALWLLAVLATHG